MLYERTAHQTADASEDESRWLVVFPRAGLYKGNLCVPCTLLTHLPTLSGFSCIVMAHSESAMLNIEAFRELCRRAAIETDPTALQRIKEALRLMLRVEQIELHAVEKRPGLKSN